MNKLSLIIFLFATNLFSQNNSIISFEVLKEKMILNKIDIDKIDSTAQTLNDTEISILKTLNNSDKDFKNKIITFISGSAGTTISKKKYFFESFKNYYLQNDVLQFTIIELDEKERLLSGSDFLIFYWVKFFNSKSKSLLKKIKKYNQT